MARVNREGSSSERSVLVNPFMIGCDPEFVVANSSGGIQTVDIGEDCEHGEIGIDHGGRVVELRPNPHRSTFLLTRRIKGLIDEAQNILPTGTGYKWRAGAYTSTTPRQAVGGHIHVDLSPYDPNEDRSNPYNEPYEGHIARIAALDRFCRAMEKLDILPRAECITRRRSGGYGNYGEYRVNMDDGRQKPRFEYRTMPSWLFDPVVTYTCLTGAKLLALAPEASEGLKGNNLSEIHDLFAAFAHKDLNAKRWMEKVVPARLRNLDPDRDIREAWREVGL